MRVRALTLSAVVLAFAIPRDAATKAPEVYPLSKVRPGQKGVGRTVFQGTKPEEFTFEVIGVAKNFLPKQDVIIFKSEDPKMTEVGITAGMSGSPLYIDGKVACALAYGWRFNKKAIGGCTPIEYMIRDASTPRRGVEQTSRASIDEWNQHAPLDRFAEARDVMSPGGGSAWMDHTPLPPLPASPADTENGLVRASLPLSVSGLSPRAFEHAKQIFQPYGVEPMQSGGGSGDANGGPSSFEMGGAIGVQLVSGDMSAVATGTVSYIDGKTVIGFGHPMFGMGEAYVPIVSAEILTIIPSMMSSFKLSSPGRVLGSLTQDRQSSIAGDTSLTADMIPVDVKIRGAGGAADQTFHADIMRHRFLTPQLLMLVVASAAQVNAPDITDATLLMKSKLVIKGHEPLVFTDHVYSVEGASPNALGASRALRALVPLLFNPYQPVKIDRFEIEIEVSYKPEFTEIIGLRVPELELPSGEKTYVEVVMRPYGGKEYVEKIPLEIPERLAGSTMKLEVVPGDAARPDVAPPTSFDDVMAALRKTYPANTLVATLYTPDEGLAIGGKLLPDLPDSAIDTARHAASTRRGDSYKSIARTVVPLRKVVVGKQEMVVKIKERK